MFKSIAIATLALLMTVEGTSSVGMDLYNEQKEAQQEIQQRKAEEALDDDTTCLEENPEAYMTEETEDGYTTPEEMALDDDTTLMRESPEEYMLKKQGDYRRQVFKHREDAETVLRNIFQVDGLIVEIYSYSLYCYSVGTVTVPGYMRIPFTMTFDAHGPIALEMNKTTYVINEDLSVTVR